MVDLHSVRTGSPMLTVYCQGSKSTLVWRYYLCETHDEKLIWYVCHGPYPGNQELSGQKINVFARTGNMSGCEVLPSEAEEITSLHMPAALDRLREMLYGD